jgi:light-regulated signal transduction histidine kinase (bacteriophytochrome)
VNGLGGDRSAWAGHRGIVRALVATTLPPTFLAEFRHDLANPVNHVVGYAELLVMGATERQATELQPPLEAISRLAGDLRRHLEEHLPLTRIRTQDVDLPTVRSCVTASASELLQQVASLRPQLAGRWAEAEDDLAQIENAARRLLELAKRSVEA